MRTWIVMSWFVAFLVGVSCLARVEAQDDDEPEVLLQEAKHEELVNGDLKAAIEIYERILDQYKNSREANAKALLRLGVCCEKLGRVGIEKARAHYEELVREYPEQHVLVRSATRRLDALRGRMPASRLVWDNAIDWTFTGKPSPDGKYLSYLDTDNGGLSVRDLVAGKHRQVAKGPWPSASIFSPDGKQIAYSANTKGYSFELRIVDLVDLETRTIYGDQEDCWITPTAWSPDGKWIAATVTAKNENGDPGVSQIALLSAQGRSLRTLKSPYRGIWQQWMSFSPDGVYLACTLAQDEPPPGKREARGDVFLLATDGSGREIQVIKHGADDYALGWSPNGKNLIFASDRTGTPYAYTIAISDGRPQGIPKLIGHIGWMNEFTPIGFSDDGSFYYGRQLPGEHIYTATLDTKTGKTVVPPQKAIRHREGTQSAPDWTSDGKLLACRARLGESVGFLIQSENGQIRELEPKFEGESGINFNFLRWSPDRKFLLCHGRGNDGKTGLVTIDAETGEVKMVVEGRAYHPNWSPDGMMVYYLDKARKLETSRLCRRVLKTGVVTELCRAEGVGSLIVSPDGRELAFLAPHSAKRAIHVISAQDGKPRRILDTGGGHSLAWTPDGRYILFVKGENNSQLWRVATEGGSPERLELEVSSPMRHLRIHPDGRQIAFNLSQSKSQVWVTENFVPSDEPLHAD